MKLIIGLGNIGAHFDGTRHNIGFATLDTLASSWLDKPKFKALVAEIAIKDQKVLLIKPKTYYNQSGEAVEAIRNFYKLANNDILVIHDELALPFGTVRSRLRGSDAGNNGIKSIVATIGADFARIRVGIANNLSEKIDAADFVLAQFSKQEAKALPDVMQNTKTLVDKFLDGTLAAESLKVKV